MTGELEMIRSGGATIGVEQRGEGPVLVLIHAGVFSSWFVPLAAEPALADHTVIRVVRAGYAGIAPPDHHLSIDGHADLCAAVLDGRRLSDVHLVGHSSGSLVALALAASRPELVASVVAIEPAPPGPPDPMFRSFIQEPIETAMASGDVATAFDHFMGLVCATDYEVVLQDALGPGGLEAARSESEFFFRDEVSAVQSWNFDDHLAQTITQPARILAGGASPPPVWDTARMVTESLPDATLEEVPGADHLWPLRDPGGLAERVRRFVQEVEGR